MDRWGPPSMPRTELGTAFPTRQGSTCYEKLCFGLPAMPGWLFVRRGSPDPAVRLTGDPHVTRRRSGTGRPGVAEDGGSGDRCRTSFPMNSRVLFCFSVHLRLSPPVHGASGSRAPARGLYKTNFSPVLDGRAVEKSREIGSSGSEKLWSSTFT